MRLGRRRWGAAQPDPVARTERHTDPQRRSSHGSPAVEVGHPDADPRTEPVARAESVARADYAGRIPTVGGAVDVGAGVEDIHRRSSIRDEASTQHHDHSHHNNHDDSHHNGDQDRHRDCHCDCDEPGLFTQPDRQCNLIQRADEHDREPNGHAHRPASGLGVGHDLVAVAAARHRRRRHRPLVVDQTTTFRGPEHT